MKFRWNERGSALIEASFALYVLGAVLLVAGIGLYYAFAKSWMARSAREAAVCLETRTPSFVCRRKLEATLASALPFGEPVITRFQNGRRGSEVSVGIAMPIPEEIVSLPPFFIQVSARVANISNRFGD